MGLKEKSFLDLSELHCTSKEERKKGNQVMKSEGIQEISSLTSSTTSQASFEEK